MMLRIREIVEPISRGILVDDLDPDYPLIARTSPVYVMTGVRAPEVTDAAALFDQALDEALEWVQQRGKFRNAQQLKEVIALFKEGQDVYQRLRIV